MQDQDLLYRIGITLVKGIGCITARQVIETFGDASFLFKEKKRLLERIPGISRKILSEIHQPDLLKRAEKEIQFIEKNKITPLFITDKDYPYRLKDCIDAPVLLYLKGNVNLNPEKSISIVGTRNATAYGKEITDNLIQDVSSSYPEILIISGLAYGIDVCSHKAALKHSLPTVGVLAHGLDRIYPYSHRNIAVEMLSNGGLLSDFMSGNKPDRQNFIKRNRIVAGMSDCTIVVESAEKGGALITSSIADSYNKDVFAFPGKVNDPYSLGCNKLIREKKASLITSADDLFKEMGWDKTQVKPPVVQKPIFQELSPEEETVIGLFSKQKKIQLNSMAIETNFTISKLAAILFEMEMKGLVRCMPGGIYERI
ncbi:MAG: DNA-processing protein DprA [Bacteroidales bacterium]|nr:DNA-processing protein DprA [Bacteroidales bacterium]